jgi:hypothetical protein
MNGDSALASRGFFDIYHQAAQSNRKSFAGTAGADEAKSRGKMAP